MSYKFLNSQGEHLHTLDDISLHGVSTVTDVLGKTLTWWASGKCAEQFGWKPLNRDDNNNLIHYKDKSALEARLWACKSYSESYFQKIKKLSKEAYFELLQAAYKAHDTIKKEKADLGVDLHAEVERYIKDQISGEPPLLSYLEQIQPFIEWSKENVKKWLFSELHVFSSKLWIGGIVDNGFIDKDNRLIVGDIKSAPKTYFNHLCQVGGYCCALTEQKAGFDADGNKIFTLPQTISGIAVFPFGKGFKKPYLTYDVKTCMENFEACLVLHKSKKLFEKGA